MVKYLKKNIVYISGLIIIWVVVYKYLSQITNFIIDDIFKLESGTHLTETLRFFIYEVPKVFLLLSLIIFIVVIV